MCFSGVMFFNPYKQTMIIPILDMILDIDFKIKLNMENKILKFLNRVSSASRSLGDVWNERETMVLEGKS